jgi:hypothetical protein
MLQVTMLASLTLASVATRHLGIRAIGLAAGCLSTLPSLAWAWANWAGLLVEPTVEPIEPRQEEFTEPVTPA